MSQSKFGDFLNFKVMISPVIVMVIFWLGIAAIVVAAIVLFLQGQILVGIGTVVLGPFVLRIICEYLIVVYKMHDCLETIAKNTEMELLQNRDMALKKQSSGRSYVARQKTMEYGVMLSEISVGEHFETRDGKEFRVVEFTPEGIRVEFAEGKREILSPVDSGMPEEQRNFDIRPA